LHPANNNASNAIINALFIILKILKFDEINEHDAQRHKTSCNEHLR
jgi:hypothetical protein